MNFINDIQRKLYGIYSDMKKRCHCESYKQYKDYGGRGIKVCDEWCIRKHGFLNFYNWAINSGYKEGLTIDREDVNGNYEPNNCRWITIKEQQRNKRSNRLITINGETKLLIEWAEEYNLDASLIRHRISKGLRDSDLISKPKEMKHVNFNYLNKNYNPNSFCKEFGIPKTSFYRMYFDENIQLEEILKKYNKI